MNPDLTRQITERLSKLHEKEVVVSHPGTEVQGLAHHHVHNVTVAGTGQPSFVASPTGYMGTLSGESLVMLANGTVVTASDVREGDALSSTPINIVGVGDLSNVVTLPAETAHDALDAKVLEEDTIVQGDNELDDEFWKSLGMKGPEDMTPDKLTEITKKLQEFGQSLKRMQRQHPTTMGVAVRVKQRTPKKRKRKH